MIKIAHIADTHIRNLKYHYEYKVIFSQIYETLRNEKVDYIVHCGDIAHTKTQISPEFVEMASEFFYNLGEIAPTYIILGNHDGNLKNSSRQDAITPIINALDHDNLHLLKNSGETDIGNDVVLNVLSVFDEDNWTNPTDEDKINIALYHGAVQYSKTDTGFSMTHGDHDIAIFEGFDYAMLGDIHQRQYLNERRTIWYAGSTVQQNFGETDDKGILIWNIKNKKSHTIKPVAFSNPRPFLSWNIELDVNGNPDISNFNPPEGARIRVIADNSLSIDQIKKATEVVKHKFNPESVTFLNRATSRNSIELGEGESEVLDLRDIKVQEELIEEYLESFNLSQDELENVYRLNKKYNDAVSQKDDISRNVNWSLESVRWDNLFNYGEGNEINFQNLNGIVGIFGKNFSGKSSIIDSILFSMFNSTSKNEKKNLNVINQNKNKALAKLDVTVGEQKYVIEREAEKYTKKLKGVETLEAKTDVTFYSESLVTGDIAPLNGTTRNETDKAIRNHFGSLEDFLLTSMSSQNGALNFISEGASKRKEIFAKFLDLNQFEQKYRLAKEDSAEVRAMLKKLDGRDFKQENKEQIIELAKVTRRLNGHEEDCKVLSKQIEELNSEIALLESTISAVPTELIDIAKVRNKIVSKKTRVAGINNHIEELTNERKEKEDRYKALSRFEESFDINGLNTRKVKIDELLQLIDETEQELKSKEREYKSKNSKKSLLEEHEYDPDCKFCCENKFVKDANIAIAQLPAIQLEMNAANEKIAAFETSLGQLDPNKVSEHLLKFQKLLNKKVSTSSRITEIGLQLERDVTTIKLLSKEIEELEKEQQKYEDNKEAIESLESMLTNKDSCKAKLKTTKRTLAKCEKDRLDYYKQTGSIEEKMKNLEELSEQHEEYRSQYSAYDLYMQCMHSSGIAFDVIKKKLPVINEEISKTIANIVDFNIFFEVDGGKFEIYIKHPKHDPRPLEMGSGAEKTIAAMAIRMALLTVSSMPKGNIFILDEPGTALDEENMEGFIRILELIKVNFKTVLLVSHLDSLKDCLDMQIVIDKKDGYAHVKH
jgi:DNA repair exonuclease SbcCD ATPase subunit/DNA repair exonuclease SbcCD nuclease subunit